MKKLVALSILCLLMIAADPDDPSEPNQWYLDKIDAHEMWDFTKGSTATPARIGIVGGGIGYTQLSIDIDSNVQAEQNFTTDPNMRDLCGTNGASTSTAHIMAAETNNNQHVAGIAWTADIFMAKAIRETCTANDTDVTEAIDWLVTQDVDVILLEWNPVSGTYTNSLAAIDDAIAANILVVMAAPEYNNMGVMSANDEVVLVVATDTADQAYPQASNNADIDLAAPYVGGSPIVVSGGCCISNLGGARFAAAQVAAVLGIFRSEAIGRWQSLNGVLTGAEDIGDTGEDNAFGAGRLNAHCALGAVGDMNNTGDVDTSDALVILNNYYGLGPGYGETIYDVNGDDYIDLADVLLVLKFFGAGANC